MTLGCVGVRKDTRQSLGGSTACGDGTAGIARRSTEQDHAIGDSRRPLLCLQAVDGQGSHGESCRRSCRRASNKMIRWHTGASRGVRLTASPCRLQVQAVVQQYCHAGTGTPGAATSIEKRVGLWRASGECQEAGGCPAKFRQSNRRILLPAFLPICVCSKDLSKSESAV